jgi:hypothetical protein
MPWDRRGRHAYYHSCRVEGRATRRYLGRGPEVEKAAAEVERRKAERAALARQLRAEERQHAAAVGPLEEVSWHLNHLARAALGAAGYHQHDRGAWRRRRHGMSPTDQPAR